MSKGNFFQVDPLPAGCPWAEWTRPNAKWCENNLCAYITTPANTWSNVAYLIVGFLMIYQAKSLNSKTLAMFGPACIMTGISSFAFHASYTYVFQIFDFFGMFCFLYLAIVVNFRRLGFTTKKHQVKIFCGLVLVSTLLVPLSAVYKFPYQLIVFFLVAYTLVQEYQLRNRGTRVPDTTTKPTEEQVDYTQFKFGLLFMLIGSVCSASDATRVWCDPDNHLINGHASWHGFTAIGLYCFFRFYKQFPFD